MADLNTTYHPYIVKFDFDAIKREIWYDLFPDDSEVKQNMTKFLNELSQQNDLQASTANAVSVEYTGKTDADRVVWLKARIDAIYNRLDLIRAFVDGYKAQLTAAGAELPTNPLATISSVLTLVPFTAPVGAAGSLITRLMSNGNENAVYRQQKVQESTSAITGFAADVSQLQLIRQQLLTEYSAIKDTPTDTDDPTGNAPEVPTTWLYAGLGVALIIAFLIWKRRKKRKRSRR